MSPIAGNNRETELRDLDRAIATLNIVLKDKSTRSKLLSLINTYTEKKDNIMNGVLYRNEPQDKAREELKRVEEVRNNLVCALILEGRSFNRQYIEKNVDFLWRFIVDHFKERGIIPTTTNYAFTLPEELFPKFQELIKKLMTISEKSLEKTNRKTVDFVVNIDLSIKNSSGYVFELEKNMDLGLEQLLNGDDF